MSKLKIDAGDLLMAFESGDGMMVWYLDRETGEVIGMSEWDDGIEEEEEIRAAIDEDESGRYVPIEALSSHEGFRIMEDFAEGLPEGRARDELLRALDRQRPFRSFKDALGGFPEVREAWFRFHEARLREEALAWLKLEEIDAELV